MLLPTQHPSYQLSKTELGTGQNYNALEYPLYLGERETNKN